MSACVRSSRTTACTSSVASSRPRSCSHILRQHRFLGVVGSSGSGKSSLVRAGLLPGLLGGFLVQDRDRWRMVQMKPGDAPIDNLASGLLKAMEQAADARGRRAARTGAFAKVIPTPCSSSCSRGWNATPTCSFSWTSSRRSSRSVASTKTMERRAPIWRGERNGPGARPRRPISWICSWRLAEQRSLPIYVVLTMRTDFLGDCDLFYGLPEALNRGRYLVPRMTREQLREAVECPALLLGAQHCAAAARSSAQRIGRSVRPAARAAARPPSNLG